MRRWRGLKALVHDAVDATTALVGEGQASVGRNVLRVTDPLEPVAAPARLVSGAVGLGAAGTLGAVRLVNRLVEGLSDAILDGLPVDPDPDEPPIALRSDAIGTPAWAADAALGAVNGAVGDHLAARDNGLGLGLVLRSRDRYLDPAAPSPVGPVSDTLVVLVHGLGTTEWSWCLDAAAYHGDPAATFGSMLERDLGATPIFVRYNTGRPIPDNGRELAQRLEDLCAAWPVPLARVVLLGHSMGGLVARAACHTASSSGHRWLGAVDLVISLGTPHRGARLARAGESIAASLGIVDLPATRVLAGILAGRSAGIRHLERGDVGELGLEGAVPLLDGITYACLSATVTADPDHPVGAWLGDLLVTQASASGPLAHEAFPIETATFGGVLHHQIQCHPAVYDQIRRIVAHPRGGEAPPRGQRRVGS